MFSKPSIECIMSKEMYLHLNFKPAGCLFIMSDIFKKLHNKRFMRVAQSYPAVLIIYLSLFLKISYLPFSPIIHNRLVRKLS